jgi:hypothetical protein
MKRARFSEEQIIGILKTGSRAEGQRPGPGERDQRGNDLKLESKLWWAGSERRPPVTAVGRGEPAVEAPGRRSQPGQRGAESVRKELLARIAELERQAGYKKNAGALSFKVSDKGAVSVYDMGRFPVPLYTWSETDSVQ